MSQRFCLEVNNSRSKNWDLEPWSLERICHSWCEHFNLQPVPVPTTVHMPILVHSSGPTEILHRFPLQSFYFTVSQRYHYSFGPPPDPTDSTSNSVFVYFLFSFVLTFSFVSLSLSLLLCRCIHSSILSVSPLCYRTSLLFPTPLCPGSIMLLSFFRQSPFTAPSPFRSQRRVKLCWLIHSHRGHRFLLPRCLLRFWSADERFRPGF